MPKERPNKGFQGVAADEARRASLQGRGVRNLAERACIAAAFSHRYGDGCRAHIQLDVP